jgi:hypothetical protein
MLRLLSSVSDPALPTVLNLRAIATGSEGVLIGRSDPGSFTRPYARVNCANYPLSVSRQHAVIRHANGGFEIRDVNSLNGTYVNGERLNADARHALQCGDLVTFGGPEIAGNNNVHNPHIYVFDPLVSAGAAQADEAPPADPAPAVHTTFATAIANHINETLMQILQAHVPRVEAPEALPAFVPKQALALPADAQAPHALGAAIADWCLCVVCHETMVAPHALPNCDHSFCGGCIHTWLERNDSCPSCREPAKPPSYSKILDDVLRATVVPQMDAQAREAREAREREWHTQRHAVKESRKRSREAQALPDRFVVSIGPPPIYAALQQVRARAEAAAQRAPGTAVRWSVRYSRGGLARAHNLCATCGQAIGLGLVEAVDRRNHAHHASCINWRTRAGPRLLVRGTSQLRAEDCNFLI